MQTKHTWTQTKIWRLIAVAMLVIAVVLAMFLTQSLGRKNAYAQQLNNAYDQALGEISGNVSNMGAELAKLRVSTSQAQQALLLGGLWRLAGETQGALSTLPLPEDVSEPLLTFVNELGDYCYLLSQKIEQGTDISQEEYDTLKTMEEQSNELSKLLDQRRAEGIHWDIDDPSKQLEMLNGSGENASKVMESMQQRPRLIYDGAFSEKAENIQPKNAQGPEVSVEQALEMAESFFPGDYEQTGEQNEGLIPTYEFQCTMDDGLVIDVSVTKRDGLLYQALPNSAGSETVRPSEEQLSALEETAAQYLQQRGYPEMRGAYAQYYNGMAVLNMLPVQNEVYLYPDLVKVWIEVESGRIVGMDANNYIVYHTDRQMENKTTIDQAAMEQRVAQRLDIQACRLALIPTDDMGEALCYEFVGTNGGDSFYVHINAETGEEEDILQIIDAEDGTFVY